MPVLAGPEMTEAAISDVLAQSVPTRLLIINQGVDDAFRDHLERLAEQDERILCWHHMPPLPSLSASWNLALDLVWQSGGEVAFVVNNDVRLHPQTVSVLRQVLQRQQALFVSAVGVTAEQFAQAAAWAPETILVDGDLNKGGPDFSCFLISKACHERFRFDEGFIPAHTEDLDLHRRLMLAGEGQRIFSVNMPYLHYAAQTLKLVDPKTRARIEYETATIARAHYARKWGGPVNAETFWYPFDAAGQAEYPEPLHAADFGDPTTPKLFDHERTLWARPSTS